MPASNMSRISSMPHSNTAASLARDAAKQQIAFRMKSGQLRNQSEVEREFFSIYNQEYYRIYAHLLHQEKTRIVDNPSAHKYFDQHVAIGMNRVNCFLQADQNRITVYRISFPIDNDVDTREAHLSVWPGPLDRADEYLKRRVTDYLDTLWQHESQRTLRYFIANHDEHRKVILRLLTELLHRNGFIDAPGITRLLLPPRLTEIQKDEADVIETLQKYLLLGKRFEAIKFAKSKKLWDHAQCLAFLHKYQPPATSKYSRDEPRLCDDPLVQLNDEYINSIHRHDMLKIVYKSLLNRILQSDPSSLDAIKHHDVKNKDYEFALLCANDCEMDFDQSNETFKLIMAVKNAAINQSTSSHLISLGYTVLEAGEPSDNLSYRSNPSFKMGDSMLQDSASKIQALSNMDMLILNEIWEYCLNLARGTCNPDNYIYNMNLIPYKLIFAWRLLEYGLHSVFPYYLDSIGRALAKTKSQQYADTNSPYDWTNIEHCVENLSRVWHIFNMSYNGTAATSPVPYQYSGQPESLPSLSSRGGMVPDMGFNHHQSMPPVAGFNPPTPAPAAPTSTTAPHQHHHQHHQQPPTTSSLPTQYQPAPVPQQPPPPQTRYPAATSQPQTFGNDYTDTSNYPSLNYQNEHKQPSYAPPSNNLPKFPAAPPPPSANQPYIQPYQSDVFDYNPEGTTSYPNQDEADPYGTQQSSYNDFSGDASRRQSASMAQPPSFSQHEDRKPMTSSSPVNREPEFNQPPMGESFNSPFSPINDLDDLPRRSGGSSRHNSMTSPSYSSSKMDHNVARQNVQGSDSNNDNSKPAQQSSNQQQQQSKFPSITSFVGSLLPKSNSKPMILPDDTEKTFKYDDNKKAWVDTTQGEGAETSDPFSEPPPMMMNASKPPASYSFANKSSRSRYPQA